MYKVIINRKTKADTDIKATGLKRRLYLIFNGLLLYEKDGCINFARGSFDWISEILVPFLRGKTDSRTASPSPNVLSPKCI